MASRQGEDYRATLLFFVDAAHRDDFITSLEECFDASFLRTKRPQERRAAARAPFWICVGIAVLFGAIAGLSSYWIAHPPMPPRGKPQGDELVLFLTGAGPQGVLLAGLVPLIPCLAWLVWRLVRPPMVQRFTNQANRPVE